MRATLVDRPHDPRRDLDEAERRRSPPDASSGIHLRCRSPPAAERSPARSVARSRSTDHDCSGSWSSTRLPDRGCSGPSRAARTVTVRISTSSCTSSDRTTSSWRSFERRSRRSWDVPSTSRSRACCATRYASAAAAKRCRCEPAFVEAAPHRHPRSDRRHRPRTPALRSGGMAAPEPLRRTRPRPGADREVSERAANGTFGRPNGVAEHNEAAPGRVEAQWSRLTGLGRRRCGDRSCHRGTAARARGPARSRQRRRTAPRRRDVRG
jgi:hypothetical protein